MDDITSFGGEYRWLSNFYPCHVKYGSYVYPSVENAFQAAKVTDESGRGCFLNCTASDAKHLGRRKRDIAKEQWDACKVDVMRELIERKFARGMPLAEKLKATHPAQLVEGNWWGDTFWGVCKGVGENMLGKLLMERRAALLNE